MTLMPVSSSSVLPSSWSKLGGLRWMPHCSPSRPRPGVSRQSPRALKTWPLTMSPTGTEIGLPESVTVAPRTRPSVGCMEMVRTMLSPRCWATSSVSVLATEVRVTSACRALNSSGMEPRGNSTSTTGPMTRTTRPAAPPVRLVLSCVTAAVIGVGSLRVWLRPGRAGWYGPFAQAAALLVAVRARRQRVHAADDLADFLRDLGLTDRVGLALQDAGEFVGVVGGRLHCGAPSRRLGCRCLEQRRVDTRVDVLRQQRRQQHICVGLEFVLRLHLGRRGVGDEVLAQVEVLVDEAHLDRRQAAHLRGLGEHRDEPRVDDVQLVD